jgi:hypothetical protein
MRNDDDSREHGEDPSVRRCGHCGDPLLTQRRGARFCSRECKELARARRRRASRRVTAFRRKHPLETDLAVLHDRARPPGHRADAPSVYSDFGDLPEDYDDDDEQGIYSGPADPGRWQDSAFARGQAMAKEVERIRADYDRRARPYLDVQRRNGGVVRPELAALVRERDAKISDLTRAHQKAEAYELAERNRPKYIASAHERQMETAALRAFAKDLGRGRRVASQPPTAGRPTEDVFLF